MSDTQTKGVLSFSLFVLVASLCFAQHGHAKASSKHASSHASSHAATAAARHAAPAASHVAPAALHAAAPSHHVAPVAALAMGHKAGRAMAPAARLTAPKVAARGAYSRVERPKVISSSQRHALAAKPMAKRHNVPSRFDKAMAMARARGMSQAEALAAYNEYKKTHPEIH